MVDKKQRWLWGRMKGVLWGERRQWRQTRNDNSVAASGRQATQCEGGVAMMTVAEGMMARDERSMATADETVEIEVTMVMG